MDVTNILNQLHRERDQIAQAIENLERIALNDALPQRTTLFLVEDKPAQVRKRRLPLTFLAR
jgi:hypothetical protein